MRRGGAGEGCADRAFSGFIFLSCATRVLLLRLNGCTAPASRSLGREGGLYVRVCVLCVCCVCVLFAAATEEPGGVCVWGGGVVFAFLEVIKKFATGPKPLLTCRLMGV